MGMSVAAIYASVRHGIEYRQHIRIPCGLNCIRIETYIGCRYDCMYRCN